MTESIFDQDIDYGTLDRIQKELFRNSPVLIDIQRQGQWVENGQITLGLRAGPHSHIVYLLHEIAHLVNIDDRRMRVAGWGLRYGKWTDYPYSRQGGWYTNFSAQHIEREIDVHAIQWVLAQHFQLRVTLKDLTSACIYLPNFGIAQKITDQPVQSEKEFHQFFLGAVKNSAQTKTVEDLYREWWRKMQILREEV